MTIYRSERGGEFLSSTHAQNVLHQEAGATLPSKVVLLFCLSITCINSLAGVGLALSLSYETSAQEMGCRPTEITKVEEVQTATGGVTARVHFCGGGTAESGGDGFIGSRSGDGYTPPGKR